MGSLTLFECHVMTVQCGVILTPLPLQDSATTLGMPSGDSLILDLHPDSLCAAAGDTSHVEGVMLCTTY
eukprot:m.299356 g.299356  ORF g.299356 m.299356 type:complete len:69 (-) comp27234_c1_seq2:1049-1255(-)